MENKTYNQKSEIFEKIIKICLFLLVFLLPLFFLPWTINVLEVNKLFLLGLLVFIALIFWILRVLNSGKIEFTWNYLIIPILVMLLFYIISTIFSQWFYGSFWGWPLKVSSGFISLICLVLFYFLVINTFNYSTNNLTNKPLKEPVFLLVFSLISSAFLVSILGILQILGKFILPWEFTKTTSFNTIGTTNSLATFLAVVLPIALSLVIVTKRWLKTALIVFALTVLSSLIVINFWPAWLILIIESVILLIFQVFNIKDKKPLGIYFSIALLAIALFFVVFRGPIFNLSKAPSEVYLTQKSEINIIKNAIIKNPSFSLFFGTGPGTFVYNFLKFKPEGINQTIFWNLRFISGASELLDLMLTTGILGVLSLLVVFIFFFWLGFKYFRRESFLKENKENWYLSLGLFSGFTGIAFAYFIRPFNLSLCLVFWTILSIFTIYTRKKVKVYKIVPLSSGRVLISFVLITFLIFSFGLFFIGAKKYTAEVNYFRGLNSLRNGEIDKSIVYLKKAVSLNPEMDIYWRELSQLYLFKINKIFQNPEITSEEKNSLNEYIVNAMSSSKKATDLNSKNVANWNVKGFICRNLIGVARGADRCSLVSLRKAAELDPENPYIPTELGRVYILKSDIEKESREKNLKLAMENLKKAISLKRDYAPAHFLIAMVYIREGKTKEAIEKLEALERTASFDAGLAFQLGIVYYQDNQLDKAKREFERAVKINSNYSNARYFLGLIYSREGDRNKAIEQFEEISELNPHNKKVKDILANLKNGKPALEGIQEKNLPPIGEEPPEIQINR